MRIKDCLFEISFSFLERKYNARCKRKKENRERYTKKIRGILVLIDSYLGWFTRWIISKNIILDKKKIVFFTTVDTYICNPKYICEEILRNHLDVELVWITQKKIIEDNNFFPRNVRIVYYNSIAATKEILTAHIIIDNGYKWQERGYFPKVKGQIVIQTWHGSLGLKRFDPNADNNKKRVKAAIREGKLTDFCISNSSFETNQVYPIFWDNAEIWEIGHPRNDLLFADDNVKKDITLKVKTCLNIPEETKLILYAPTYRDSKTLDVYDLDFNEVIYACHKRFGGKWNILVRFHPTMKNKIHNYSLNKSHQWIDASSYPDIQELMVAADFGITDYSSWICDFVLLNKPGALYANDIEEYSAERGLYYSLGSTPFIVAMNTNNLKEKILQYDEGEYCNKVRDYLDHLGCVERGNAASIVVEKIKGFINEK